MVRLPASALPSAGTLSSYSCVCTPTFDIADYQVLKQFPFHRVKPARVVFETMHLSNVDNNAVAAMMMRHGYTNILGGLGKVGMSIWHDAMSKEVYNTSRLGQIKSSRRSGRHGAATAR